MTALITLTTAGADSGPFNLFTNVDSYVTAFAIGVTKASLVAGYSSAVVPDGATIIRVKSTGACTNFIDITLSNVTTTTTSSSTTTTSTTLPPPRVTLGSASCKSGNCNDNSTCSVHLPVTVSNAPIGYYVQMTTISAVSASASYLQGNGYVLYTESNALASIQIKLDLYNTVGGTLLYSTGYLPVSHQSFWSMLPSC